MDLITSLTSQVVHKAMSGLSKRHKAIASNLANVDTPGYRRRDVSFEANLQQALEDVKGKGSPKHQVASNDQTLAMRATRPEHFGVGQTGVSIDGVKPEIIESEDVQYRNDGNAVDVETEMVQLTKNTQRYLALAKMEGRRVQGLKHIINGG